MPPMRHKTFLIMKLLWGFLKWADIEKAAERERFTALEDI
jgi:hypothetical protein